VERRMTTAGVANCEIWRFGKGRNEKKRGNAGETRRVPRHILDPSEKGTKAPLTGIVNFSLLAPGALSSHFPSSPFSIPFPLAVFSNFLSFPFPPFPSFTRPSNLPGLNSSTSSPQNLGFRCICTTSSTTVHPFGIRYFPSKV
jgi:hypothetical protein